MIGNDPLDGFWRSSYWEKHRAVGAIVLFLICVLALPAYVMESRGPPRRPNLSRIYKFPVAQFDTYTRYILASGCSAEDVATFERYFSRHNADLRSVFAFLTDDILERYPPRSVEQGHRLIDLINVITDEFNGEISTEGAVTRLEAIVLVFPRIEERLRRLAKSYDAKYDVPTSLLARVYAWSQSQPRSGI